MRLTAAQLDSHLKSPLKPLYVLAGDEALAQRECLDAIRLAAKAQGFTERTSFAIEAKFNWQTITNFGREISLFAEKRVLEIKIASGKPGIDGSKVLQQLANAPIQDTVVIVILPKLDWREQKAAWFNALDNKAISLSLNEVPPELLPAWIAAKLKLQNQNTDAETLDFFAHQVEGNLLAAHQEIQKLSLLYPAGVLTKLQVRECILNVSRYDVVELGEAILLGDVPRTVRILQGLQDEGMNAVAALYPISWVLRPLAQVKEAEARGESLNTAFSNAKVFGDKQALFKKALARLTLKQCQAALTKLAEIDKTAKGLVHNDAWLEISRLCFGLARVKSRSRH